MAHLTVLRDVEDGFVVAVGGQLAPDRDGAAQHQAGHQQTAPLQVVAGSLNLASGVPIDLDAEARGAQDASLTNDTSNEEASNDGDRAGASETATASSGRSDMS